MKIEWDWDGVIGLLAMAVFVVGVVIDSWELGIISIMFLMAISIEQNYQRKVDEIVEK